METKQKTQDKVYQLLTFISDGKPFIRTNLSKVFKVSSNVTTFLTNSKAIEPVAGSGRVYRYVGQKITDTYVKYVQEQTTFLNIADNVACKKRKLDGTAALRPRKVVVAAPTGTVDTDVPSSEQQPETQSDVVPQDCYTNHLKRVADALEKMAALSEKQTQLYEKVFHFNE